mmetsp:Transcript_2276/g.3220  ORF Transcript_2276/g.3220 Transcript_2276/m.3220 type:complete len:463 (-) Transcript_2276:348-1736(-)|eukprot:CAMPEP_0184485394 /NCGR_PEP_ID=MMETSP0113_2-20130426/7001_1 /TAXON_ID=91329 /ORGANISM="Norrisiella sphaerica, Strain BC52" /LENGTH=462 /DNA_ID=CAMNT_0026866821 /DNA_START=193 /DNA_END=1581 /DNA_ORIENTATION=+
MSSDEKQASSYPAFPELMAPLLVEFVGTFFLCFTITLSSDSALAPLAIGGMLMAMVFMGGRISGAHYNPAVTLAVALCGKISWPKAGYYAATQVAASFVAGIVGGIVEKGEGMTAGYPSVAPRRHMSALICEFLFTFILAKVVLNVAAHSKRPDNAYYGLAIGLTVFAGIVSVGDISGAAFNPAVGTGLPLIQGSFWDLWVYWIGPALGAAFASFMFWATNGEEFALAAYAPKASPQLKLIAPYLMEGIGTFFLCFVISMSTNSLLGPLAVGGILVAMVFMSGHVSGSHFNPAVTAAVYSTGQIELEKGLYYILSQFIGGFLAAGIARLLNGWRMGYPTIAGGAASIPAALLLEMLGTFALTLTVFHTAVSNHSKKENAENSYYGLAIGMTVFALVTTAGSISGGAFNPAVGTALPWLAGEFTLFWLYWIAPTIGSLAAAGVFTITKEENDKAGFEEIDSQP